MKEEDSNMKERKGGIPRRQEQGQEVRRDGERLGRKRKERKRMEMVTEGRN